MAKKKSTSTKVTSKKRTGRKDPAKKIIVAQMKKGPLQKIRIVQDLRKLGWREDGSGAFYNESHTGDRVRVNLRDDNVATLEARRPKTKEEQEATPHKAPFKWVVLESGPYEEIRIGESGELIFPHEGAGASIDNNEERSD